MKNSYMNQYSCSFSSYCTEQKKEYLDNALVDWQKIRNIMRQQVIQLIEKEVYIFYTGLDLGAEQLGALIVLELKEQYPHLRLYAVLSCGNQSDGWKEVQKRDFFDILSRCDEVMVLYNVYTPQCSAKQVQYIVDHSEYVIFAYKKALFKEKSYLLEYARNNECKITKITF